MSESEIIAHEEKKSLDKKEIEDEEREKMLNAENKLQEEVPKVVIAAVESAEETKPAGEPITEEGREVKPKFIPIGGIKMPGFFTRSKSKEKCKDGDDGAQGELLEKPAPEGGESKEAAPDKEAGEPTTFKSRLSSIKIPNPFAKKPKPAPVSDDAVKEPEAPNTNTEATGQKKGLLNAIRLPIVNMIPRKLRSHGDAPADAEAGLDTTKTAELASMETLDDNKSTEKVDTQNDDGMENVKLDIDEKGEENGAPKEKLTLRERIRQQKFIIDDLAIVGGILVFIILLIIIIAVTCSGSGIVHAPIKDGRYIDAVTSCGLVEGVLEDGAFAFRGIPYALPPVGENRWRAAHPLDKLETCWNGTLKAHNTTSYCRQIYANGTEDGEEDCLTLDVITPHVRYDTPLPVIVLIGGNTLTGGSPGKLRPSTRYARSRDVLFVRPNFRVGVLGFLALNSLTKSTYPQTSGNYGLSDIITALKWVQLNIKHFGGDPKAVTLLGHRAGATLVTALTNLKKADQLFARAWVSSGAALFPGKPLQESEQANERYMELIKCTNSKCLREANVENVLSSVPDIWRGDSPDLPSLTEEPDKRHEWLVLDGIILNSHLKETLPDSKIPLVIGTTAHVSASEKLLLRHTNWTPELVTKHINDSKIGQLNLTGEALERYNATYQGLAAMISDIRTVCPLLSIARLRPATPFYVVTQPGGENNIADVDSDISAILGRYEPKTPEQRRYVSAMQAMFYHYVWHGTVPQVDGKHSFPVLQVGQDVLPMRDYPNCDLWISKDVVPRYARQD